MAKSKHYPKAPIIEAVLDLQVLPSKNFDNSLYESIKSELSKNFKTANIEEMRFELQLGNQQKKKSQLERKIGVRLESTDGKYVIQAKENGYAFSIIDYYECWEDFSKIAYKYWNVYKRIFKPQKVTRQALRYINRIDIPETTFELKKYFNVYPYLFDDDEKVRVSGFFMQAQMPQKEGGIANVTQTVTQPIKPGCTSVILDIDVFDNKSFRPTARELKDRIAALRDQKNFIFRSSITPETEKLIS
ncbi:MAG: TIGR04255 family protein [Alphaproteobacteria bacterium]